MVYNILFVLIIRKSSKRETMLRISNIKYYSKIFECFHKKCTCNNKTTKLCKELEFHFYPSVTKWYVIKESYSLYLSLANVTVTMFKSKVDYLYILYHLKALLSRLRKGNFATCSLFLAHAHIADCVSTWRELMRGRIESNEQPKQTRQPASSSSVCL